MARALSFADLAHSVALVEGGALEEPTARALLGGLLELHEIPPDSFPWEPALGDAFNSREAELTRRIGAASAGWLSAGRPRREAFRVALRLVARRGTGDLAMHLADAIDALAAHAERHAEDLAADYTYLQPAQPSTVGHLLLAYAYPVVRDSERLRGVEAQLALSVAGVGGSAGSRWPLDRDRLAELLGASGLVRHTKDAMWHADTYVELIAAIAMACTHASQLAQDFEILASQEFGIVELADAHSRASALMPQKRNPYALAVVRTQAGISAGELAGVLTTLHTGSARTDHFQHLNGAVPRLVEESIVVADLLAKVLEGLSIDADRWGEVARRGFTAAADVADAVAIEGGLDYRTAHKVVGFAVRQRVEADLPVADLTAAEVTAAARVITGRQITLPTAALAAALDPAQSALTRPQSGGSAPGEVIAMVQECRSHAASVRAWVAASRAALDGAETRLLAAARAIAPP